MVIALELSTKLLYFPSQACKKHFKILTLQKLFKGLRQSQLGTSQSAIKKIIERKVKKGIKKKTSWQDWRLIWMMAIHLNSYFHGLHGVPFTLSYCSRRKVNEKKRKEAFRVEYPLISYNTRFANYPRKPSTRVLRGQTE